MSCSRWLVWSVSLALIVSCDPEDECSLGETRRCDGPPGGSLRVCQADTHEFGECYALRDCNPLEQTGCDAGDACFVGSSGAYCAPPAIYPCEPGWFATRDLEASDPLAIHCRPFCDATLPDGDPRCADFGDCRSLDGGDYPVGLCLSED